MAENNQKIDENKLTEGLCDTPKACEPPKKRRG